MEPERPFCKETIWGGDYLGKLFNTDAKAVGEAWVLSSVEKHNSVNSDTNQPFEGLPDQISETEVSEHFPLLIKFIDSKEDLSIEVHPEEKNEMWIILQANPDSKIVYGFNNEYTKEFIEAEIPDGIEKLLNYIPVEKDDVFFVPSGTVHAIGAGITLLEIEENSDITYRLYDYNRLQNGVPRELHVKEALSILNCGFVENVCERLHYRPNEVDIVIECQFFTVLKIDIEEEFVYQQTKDSFLSVTVTDGELLIEGQLFSLGGEIFIPAAEQNLRFEGEGRAILARLTQ